jgi:hypothetical protein
MTISAQAMASYQKEADYRDTFYGGNASVAALRCFRRYHKDARLELVDQAGSLRWMTQKQARVHAILMRQAVSGERITMTAIAAEVLACTSTVSRAILKFQAWGMFAIDVRRGRNGGISVRLRTLYDDLQGYAKAAWQRIKAAADRARTNVASLINLRGEGYAEPEYEPAVQVTNHLLLTMDATFMETWDAAERNGAKLLADARRSEAQSGPFGVPRESHPWEDPQWVADFASAVIAERRRLAIIDPAGEAEAVRPLW